LEVSESEGGIVLKVLAGRVHLKGQREKIVEAMERIEPGRTVLVDLSEVRSFNSSSWEAVEQFAEKLRLAVSGLSREARETFYSWGFDEHIEHLAAGNGKAAKAGA
jgi:anti-anti-sigma regulatory factor